MKWCLSLTSMAIGGLSSCRFPKLILWPFILTFAWLFKVNWTLFPKNKHLYPTFASFFTRPLKNGILHEELNQRYILSPAQALLDQISTYPSEESLRLRKKIMLNDLSTEFLGWTKRAGFDFPDQFRPLVFYLSPKDYHHVHSPISGTILGVQYCTGYKYPVNPFFEGLFPKALIKNERCHLLIQSSFNQSIYIGMTAIGALGVSKMMISPSEKTPKAILLKNSFQELINKEVNLGKDLLIFGLGSTVVLYLPLTINFDTIIPGKKYFVAEKLGEIMPL